MYIEVLEKCATFLDHRVRTSRSCKGAMGLSLRCIIALSIVGCCIDSSAVMYSGARIGLSESCERGLDVCNDSNAFCDEDICQCRPGYRPAAATCRKLPPSPFIITFIIIII